MIHLPLRVRQTLFHLRNALPGAHRTPNIPDELKTRLLPGTEELFRDLSPADQAHSIAIALQLLERDASDALVIAGLLHDIGKVQRRHRITVLHRVAHVLIRRAIPGSVEWLRQLPDPPRGLGGMWALAVHDITGERIVRDLGYDERVQWLVRHHQTCDADDPELDILQAMDDRAPELSAHYT